MFSVDICKSKYLRMINCKHSLKDIKDLCAYGYCFISREEFINLMNGFKYDEFLQKVLCILNI